MTTEEHIAAAAHSMQFDIIDTNEYLDSLSETDGWSTTRIVLVVLVLVGFFAIVGGIVYCCCIMEPSKPETKTGSNSQDSSEQTPLLEGNAIRSNFREKFEKGVQLRIHTSRNIKDVRIYLNGVELRWEAWSNDKFKRYKMDLSSVLFVELGKKTKNLLRAESVQEKVCLSLIGKDNSLDIEASSQSERDELAKGFTDLINGMKGIRNV